MQSVPLQMKFKEDQSIAAAQGGQEGKPCGHERANTISMAGQETRPSWTRSRITFKKADMVKNPRVDF